MNITDFKPSFAAELLGRKYTTNDAQLKLLEMVAKIAGHSMGRQHRPVDASVDGYAIELGHSSWDRTPAEASKTIHWIFSTFKEPNPHLHIGLPAEAISIEQATSIGRAIEMLVVLDRASTEDQLLPELSVNSVTGSVLYGRKSGKGVVRLQENRWETPVRSHDLEIRQYDGEYYGRFLVGMASKLALVSDSLLIGELSAYGQITGRDKKLGNIVGAVQYASEILRRSPNPQYQDLSIRLLSFVNADGKSVRTADLREFLVTNKVNSILSDWHMYTTAH